MINAIRRHWPEYLIEAAGLGLFMISACSFAMLLFHPASPWGERLGSAAMRRVLMGLAMGSTAVALIYSPWGQRSGAHFNPAVTLTFFGLGRVSAWDTVFYALAQVAGGLSGMAAMSALLRQALADPAVNYVVTVPGPAGMAAAWFTELTISALMMSVVLTLSNHPRLRRYTGLCAGLLVAANISLAAPVSGMSMNPARTLASAIPSGIWTAIWIYFTAPPLGMWLAAAAYQFRHGRQAVFCAKLQHPSARPCIFCEWRGASRPRNRRTDAASKETATEMPTPSNRSTRRVHR